MAIYELKGVRPRLGRDVFVAETASVIGDVTLGDDVGIWFGATLRGDYFPITIGARSNLQDGAIVHITAGVAATRVGEGVTVGHGAILHGCTVGDRCLIGMGSTVLDGATVGDDSFVAAGSLVTPGTIVPPGSFVLGRPARVIRPATESERSWIQMAAELYVGYARDFRADCHRIDGVMK
jgi:carbonic anhydrase/acetyltransferase-like protein (isoleucine patch superfamily)